VKVFKWVIGILLLGVLVLIFQLSDPPQNSPAAKFQRLPEVSLPAVAEAEWAAGRPDSALLVLDYAGGNTELRQKIIAQLAGDSSAVARVRATGVSTLISGPSSYASLAGSSVADAVLYGEIADAARQGAFDAPPDAFITGLNQIGAMAAVFPPSAGAITLTKAAHRSGAMNESLTRQLTHVLTLIQPDPKGALSVEKFRENFMPVFELAKRCRTWGEFQTILRQANSADQVKVLTKMAAAAPASAKQLAQVLTIAGRDGQATPSACLDYLLSQGPKGLDVLWAAASRGPAGLKFASSNPGLSPNQLVRVSKSGGSIFGVAQDKYQEMRAQYGAMATAGKYLLLAVCAGLLVLVLVPGRYLEKLIARPGGPVAAPGAVHYLLSALAVGIVLSAVAYIFSLSVRPLAEPVTAAAAVAGESGTAVAATKDSALLSGTMVLLSLAIHAVVWFVVRGKIRAVEDDEKSPALLRLKKLENLDVFLDLPLFTGLALTVIAFILITLDAGMSRHFAYTATVVGILSSVSLRIRYLYPLKERLIQS
jgi:hypothetical protein